MASLKNKIRKSCQPSNLSNSPRLRQKFFTGVKRQDIQHYQLNIQGKHMHQNIHENMHQEPIPSDSIITSDDFSRDQLIRAFYFISDKKQIIIPQDLSQFLIQQNEEQFKKYQMIRMLDKDKKGYITKQQFLHFYQDNVISNQNQTILPEKFIQKKIWKQTIQSNYQFLSKLQDKQYCYYLKNQIKKLKDVNLNLSMHK